MYKNRIKMCTCTHVHFYILYCHLRKYILILFSLAKQRKKPIQHWIKKNEYKKLLKGILYVQYTNVTHRRSGSLIFLCIKYIRLALFSIAKTLFRTSKAFFHNVFFFLLSSIYTKSDKNAIGNKIHFKTETNLRCKPRGLKICTKLEMCNEFSIYIIIGFCTRLYATKGHLYRMHK